MINLCNGGSPVASCMRLSIRNAMAENRILLYSALQEAENRSIGGKGLTVLEGF